MAESPTLDEENTPADDDFPMSATKTKVKVPGILYFSKIPPYMKPTRMRTIFSQFGEVGRIFLQPEDQIIRLKRKKGGGSGRKNFTEGWIEYKDKKIAKAVAQSLNNSPIGGKKRGYYCEDLWNIKYLPKFKWGHISEKLAYEKASREQRMRTEMAQARKEANFYIENVAQNKGIQAMEEKRKKRALKAGIKLIENKNTDTEDFKRKFTQKGVVDHEPKPKRKKQENAKSESQVKSQLDKSLLLKVFGK